jgi:hypothetical protein
MPIISFSPNRYGKNTAFKAWAEENPEAYQALLERLRSHALEATDRNLGFDRGEWVVTPMPCADCEAADLPKDIKRVQATKAILWGIDWAEKDTPDLLPPSADSGTLE